MMDIAEKAEHQIVITVTPDEHHDGLLKVEDALLQVLAFLRVAEEGKESLGRVHEDFEWRLYSATTNSPFTVIATAIPINPTVDVTEHVIAVKSLTSRTFSQISIGEAPPGWLKPDGVAAVRGFFKRNTNGIAETTVDMPSVGTFVVDKATAANVVPALEPSYLQTDIPARVAHGEIEGRLVAVGRFYKRPALNIRTSLYGAVWCVLADRLVDLWGDEQRISSIWKGKRVIVYGRLFYATGGKLTRVEADNVRERDVPKINLDKILDPDFTAGLDPVEYLAQMHEGKFG